MRAKVLLLVLGMFFFASPLAAQAPWTDNPYLEIQAAQHQSITAQLEYVTCTYVAAEYEWSRVGHLTDFEPSPAASPESAPIQKAIDWRVTARDWLSSPQKRSVLAAAILALLITFAPATWFALPLERAKRFSLRLNDYAEAFARSPDEAQQVLLASHPGGPAPLAHVAKQVGYYPAAGKCPPPDFALDAAYRLDSPGGDCSQIVLRRADGGRVAVFEFSPEGRAWFGRRPSLCVPCGGEEVQIVPFGAEHLAAAWRSADRRRALVGARDLQELVRLIRHLEQAEQIG